MGGKSGREACEFVPLPPYGLDHSPQCFSGKVYRGTWNRTEVAIKIVRNVAGVAPRAEVRTVAHAPTVHANVFLFLFERSFAEKSRYASTLPTCPYLNAPQIWSTLRHPNILQFLGANTLDDQPFIVMPYMPNTARQFLRQSPNFDPLYIVSATDYMIGWMVKIEIFKSFGIYLWDSNICIRDRFVMVT